MKTTGSLLLTSLFFLLPVLSAQQNSPNGQTPTNPQDVPQQQAPGTNSPDISKQRRPAPDSSQGSKGGSSSKDVPQQEPGTNNPDVGKQRHDDKVSPDKGATDSGSGSSSKSGKSKGRKKGSSSQTPTTSPSN